MALFLDACALVKRYINEGESSRRMRRIMSRLDRWGGFVVSSLIEPEVISAFGKYARAQAPHEKYYFSRHPQVVDVFRRELSRTAFRMIALTDDAVESAADLLRAHPEYNIGAADAIHLATALAVLRQRPPEAPLVFVTADNGLAEAARDNGLVVFNPLHQRAEDLEEIHGNAA
jgi:predicted nucleic acid-binding protein